MAYHSPVRVMLCGREIRLWGRWKTRKWTPRRRQTYIALFSLLLAAAMLAAQLYLFTRVGANFGWWLWCGNYKYLGVKRERKRGVGRGKWGKDRL